MDISNILSKKRGQVITIDPEQTISEAVRSLAKHNIGALVVTRSTGDVVGIITERDIVRTAAEHQDVFSLLVKEVMTKEVIIGVPEDDVMSVAHTMTERRFRHIPVLDNEQHLIGIVSIGDILKAQRDQYRGQIDTLETQIMASDE